MRRGILYIGVSIFIFFIGCEKNVEIEKSHNVSSLEELRKKEVQNGEKKDILFLDYISGMNKSEYDRHTKQLLRSGKIYEDEGSLYYDIVNERQRNYQLSWQPEFFRLELYRIGITVKQKGGYITESTQDLIKVTMKLILFKQLGINDYTIKKSAVTNEPLYGWVQGNREVKLLSGFGNEVQIIYEDLATKIEKTRADSVAAVRENNLRKSRAEQAGDAF